MNSAQVASKPFYTIKFLSLWRGRVLMVHCECYLFAQDYDLMTFGILYLEHS